MKPSAVSVSQLSQVCRVEAGVIIMQIVVSVVLGWAVRAGLPSGCLLICYLCRGAA